MGLFGGGNSTQQTTNLSQTQTQDRRVVADGGSSVVNADNSTVMLNQSTTDYGAISSALQAMLSAVGLTTQTGQMALGVANNASLYGAQSSQYAVGTMGNAVSDITSASSHLNDVGLSMLQANTALTNSLTTNALQNGTSMLQANTALANSEFSKTLDTGSQDLGLNTSLAASLTNGTNNLVTHLMDTAGGLYRDAASNTAQTTQIAADLAKTQVAAQNDNRYLIAVGLAVVCIVGVMAFKGKA